MPKENKKLYTLGYLNSCARVSEGTVRDGFIYN